MCAPINEVSEAELPIDFAELWRSHSARLLSICLREMNGHRADAEDALSETMLRAMTKMPRNLQSVEAWLVRVTVNVCRDTRRMRSRHSAALHLLSVPRTQPDSFPLLERDITSLLAQLPPQLREVLVLRAAQGAGYIEIAARLGVSLANARKRVQRAHEALRALRDA